jgi:hypothetical protein
VDVPAYDFDDEDEEWLSSVNSPSTVIADEHFEALVIALENLARVRVCYKDEGLLNFRKISLDFLLKRMP